MEDDLQFIDAEQFQGGQQDKITFQLIILQHLKKILSLSCCEWTGGYWQVKTSISGGVALTDKYYVQDSRDCYSNAVNSLYDVLYPHFDKEMKADDKEFLEWSKKEENRLFKENTKVDPNGKKQWKNKETYKTDKVDIIQRKLFRLLNCFLKRVDYFKGKVFEDSN